VTNADRGSGSLPRFPTTLAIGEKATNFFPKTWSNDGTHVSTVTASGVGASSGLRTNATDTATAVVVPIGVACDLTLSSQFDQDNNPNDNHVLLPGSGPVRLAMTVHNTGQADLSVEINGLH